MSTEEIVSIVIRLVLGAAASFLAILVWAKTRDASWMLVVLGTIANYIALVYSTLTVFGVTADFWLSKNAGLIAASIISSLPTLFFIAAFAVMISRKYGIK